MAAAWQRSPEKCRSILIDSTSDADILAQRLHDKFHNLLAALPEGWESTASPQSEPDEGQNSQPEKGSSSDHDGDVDSPAKRWKKKVNDPT